MDNSVFSKSDKANIQSFSDELLVKIFSYLPMKDTFSVCLVCKQWNTIIMNTESVWKMRCHTLQRRIMDDKAQCDSWKETFQKNYGQNRIKRMWELGLFSNPASYEDLPKGEYSCMDADSWGDVLQMELDRH
uniref:F-box only protein 48-like n=1 Tax=Crassostrea virginica TaxID=6565 RepID=A0A8B8D8H9_CRAVI|nr:F-box only protein 48-like [Crassostrea virginica]